MQKKHDRIHIIQKNEETLIKLWVDGSLFNLRKHMYKTAANRERLSISPEVSMRPDVRRPLPSNMSPAPQSGRQAEKQKCHEAWKGRKILSVSDTRCVFQSFYKTNLLQPIIEFSKVTAQGQYTEGRCVSTGQQRPIRIQPFTFTTAPKQKWNS